MTSLHGGEPWLTPRQHPALDCANRAVEAVFGEQALFVREGGSIPIVVDFQTILGLPGLLVGFGLNTENLQSRTSITIWAALRPESASR